MPKPLTTRALEPIAATFRKGWGVRVFCTEGIEVDFPHGRAVTTPSGALLVVTAGEDFDALFAPGVWRCMRALECETEKVDG